MAMIVLEGMNNVGKSTLVDAICEVYDLPRFHHAPTRGEEADFIRGHIDTYGDGGLAIYDRFYWTYLAYPSVGDWHWGKDYPPSITPEFRQWAEAELRRIDAAGKLLLIHAAIPLQKIIDYEVGLNPAMDTLEVKGDLATLKRTFEEVLRDWNAVAYDFTDPASVQATRERISQFINEVT